MRHPFPLASLLLLALLPAQDKPRTAAQIVKDFRRVTMPQMSRGGDPEAVAKFKAEIADGCRKQAALAAELWEHYPDHDELPELLRIRWAGMTNALKLHDEVLTDIAQVLEDKHLRDDIRKQALHARARASHLSTQMTIAEKHAAAVAAADADPENDLSPLHLADHVARWVADPKQAASQIAEIEKRGAGTYGKRSLSVAKRAAALVGTTIEFAGTDLHGGKEIDVQKTGKDRVLLRICGGRLDDEWSTQDIEAVRKLREQHGKALAVISALVFVDEANGEEVAKAHAAAGADWSCALAGDPVGGKLPLGAPQVPCCLLLDGAGKVLAVSGSPLPLAELLVDKGR